MGMQLMSTTTTQHEINYAFKWSMQKQYAIIKQLRILHQERFLHNTLHIHCTNISVNEEEMYEHILYTIWCTWW